VTYDTENHTTKTNETKEFMYHQQHIT